MSENHKVTILETELVTHNVRRFVTEKPDGYTFEPGQATEVAAVVDGWRDEERPFTFTSLNRDPLLEFTIKIYPERDGVTDQIGDLKIGDALLIEDPFGAITYKGPGTFLAAGAGVTPFIAILRQLHADGELNNSRLLFSNHRRRDIILRGEFRRLFGSNCTFLLSSDDADEEAVDHHGYAKGRLDEKFLASTIDDFDQYLYVCGPPDMVEDVSTTLEKLGAAGDRIVTEE